MSLATRCTSCGIVFRVVQDQLRVSEGWVRCGRCDAVFNALEGLFDLDREEPPEWQAPEPPGVPHGPPAPPVGAVAGADTGPVAETPASHVEAKSAPEYRWGEASAPSDRVLLRDRNDFEDARFNTELMLDDTPPMPQDVVEKSLSADLFVQPDEAPPASWGPGDAAAVAAAEPSFLQQADRDARWQHPPLRKALWVSMAVLALLLALQGVHHFRDALAARWPAVQPALTAWCSALRCVIDAPRRIDDLSVESTGLTQTGIGANSFKLSVTLRNRGKLVVSMPWIELSVSDVNGQLVTRKALRPTDFGVVNPVIQPGTDLPLQLTLTSDGPKVSGYTVELFYP